MRFLALPKPRLASETLTPRGPAAGAFTFEYRQALLRDTWAPDAAGRGIPLTSPLSLPALLSSDVEVTQWNGEGLPGDELSVQNGLLTTRATRWPLCIDPQARRGRGVNDSGRPCWHWAARSGPSPGPRPARVQARAAHGIAS